VRIDAEETSAFRDLERVLAVPEPARPVDELPSAGDREYAAPVEEPLLVRSVARAPVHAEPQSGQLGRAEASVLGRAGRVERRRGDAPNEGDDAEREPGDEHERDGEAEEPDGAPTTPDTGRLQHRAAWRLLSPLAIGAPTALHARVGPELAGVVLGQPDVTPRRRPAGSSALSVLHPAMSPSLAVPKPAKSVARRAEGIESRAA
jgi:hypothetical protein